MDSPKVKEFLGIDVGEARIGIARGNSAARLAEPLKTIEAFQAEVELERLIKENSVSALVIGLPRGLDGSETDQTQVVRNWAKSIQTKISLPFYWQDEALTSHRAESSKQNKTVGNDAVAAAIILQDFLDGPESDRVAV